MNEQVFYLAYHLHWGYSDLMDMPTDERWAFVRQLSQQLEQEQQAIKT